MAGVLAAAPGPAMAAPISLPSPIAILEEPPFAVVGFSAQVGIMVLFELPQVRQPTLAEILKPTDVVETKLGSGAPEDVKARTERVPEPSTALMVVESLLCGSFWMLYSKMRKQHRPFSRRVRRVWRMMA